MPRARTKELYASGVAGVARIHGGVPIGAGHNITRHWRESDEAWNCKCHHRRVLRQQQFHRCARTRNAADASKYLGTLPGRARRKAHRAFTANPYRNAVGGDEAARSEELAQDYPWPDGVRRRQQYAPRRSERGRAGG